MLSQPFIIPAILFLLLAIPLILGIMPPNWGYGIRTSKTLSNKEVWYRANRFGGVVIVIASLVYLLVAATVPYSANNFTFWLIHLAAFAFPLILALLLVRSYIASL